jgi:hypothetical protein
MDRRFDAVDQGLIFLQKQITDCRQTLEAKIEENRRHALVLHEQVMSSIATMGERPPSKPRKKR